VSKLPSILKLDPARIESRKRLEQMHPADRFKVMFGLPFTPPTPSNLPASQPKSCPQDPGK